MQVKDIYSSTFFTCQPQDTLEGIVQKMIDYGTNTLIVVNNKGGYEGVVTSKHLIMAVLPDFLEDKQIALFAGEGDFDKAVCESRSMLVQDFMSTNIKPVHLDTPIVRVAANVLHQNESRLPVVDQDNKVIGIVTRTHIKNAVARILGITPTQK